VRKRVKIIANPISGRGRAKRLAGAVAADLQARGAHVVIAYTTKAGDAKTFAADVEGFDAIAVVGGDGTVNEVANGLPLGGPPISHLPSGTANVLAKEIGLPRGAAGLARVVAEGRAIPWDVGVERTTGRRVLLFVSAGYDAEVVHLFHAKRTGPVQMWQYCWWGMKSILESEAPEIAVELDGVELTKRAAWVIVSNVRRYGGPLEFTPNAKPNDGLFEVLVLHDRGRRDTVRMFWRAVINNFTGMDLQLGGVTFHQAKRVKLSSTQARVPVQIDGDPGGYLPIELEVKPGLVSILGPS
jgi:YegS/Rv2252/BmrU family lipid kinase